MGTGIDAARPLAPEHAALLDNMKDQLIIALIKRLAKGGRLILPVAEVDNTGSDILSFKVDFEKRGFVFELSRKS